MLNEERVILMTRLASYEAGEGKQNVAIGKYFRSDYIRIQTIKSIIYGTITFFFFVFYGFVGSVRSGCMGSSFIRSSRYITTR
jgi:hypothetical protein